MKPLFLRCLLLVPLAFSVLLFDSAAAQSSPGPDAVARQDAVLDVDGNDSDSGENTEVRGGAGTDDSNDALLSKFADLEAELEDRYKKLGVRFQKLGYKRWKCGSDWRRRVYCGTRSLSLVRFLRMSLGTPGADLSCTERPGRRNFCICGASVDACGKLGVWGLSGRDSRSCEPG